METPHHSKGSPVIHWICEFLQKIHPQFLQHHRTPQLAHQKERPWNWTSLQQNAFDELKCIFSSAPVLLIPNVSRPFSIMTDASLLAAGAILLQSDANQDLHPCAYFSRTFTPAQRNYDIYNRELLAVILTLEEWHQYLQGTQHPITIITDHKNLSYIKDPRKLSR